MSYGVPPPSDAVTANVYIAVSAVWLPWASHGVPGSASLVGGGGGGGGGVRPPPRPLVFVHTLPLIHMGPSEPPGGPRPVLPIFGGYPDPYSPTLSILCPFPVPLVRGYNLPSPAVPLVMSSDPPARNSLSVGRATLWRAGSRPAIRVNPSGSPTVGLDPPIPRLHHGVRTDGAVRALLRPLSSASCLPSSPSALRSFRRLLRHFREALCLVSAVAIA